jgi:biopolymer transport protein ExbB
MTAWVQHPMQYWKAGGPLLIPLAMVCFGIWLYFFRARKQLLNATEEASVIATSLRQQECSQLEKMPGAIATLVRTVLSLPQQNHDTSTAFDEGSDRIMGQLRRDIVVLAALTTIAPLLGLLGTVVGMIETFDAVSATSGETATRVASGVSSALITTQVGLAIAIPGFFGIARLRRLSNHLLVQLGAVKLHAILLERHA